MADILTLPDARKALRLPAADTSNDADLTATYIPAVTAAVEDMVGPQTTHNAQVWTADGGTEAILLPTRATAITSVVEDGVTLTANADYFYDAMSGAVVRGTTLGPFRFASGRQNVVITYNSVVTATANVVLAARIILANLWQSDQQGARPNFGSNEVEVVTTPSGFAIPRRAYELLKAAANDDLPGFA